MLPEYGQIWGAGNQALMVASIARCGVQNPTGIRHYMNRR